MNNRIEFKNYMTLMGEIFNKEITDILKNIYWEILKPYSDDQCISAFKKIIKNSTFFPRPNDFTKILEKPALNSSDAWALVMNSLSSGIEPENPMISKTISALGGWDYLSTLSYDDLYWQEKRFKEHFENFQDRKDFELLEVNKLRQLKG